MNFKELNITDQFVDSLFRINYDDFSDKDKLQAKRCFLDYLASAFAGEVLMRDKVNAFLKDSSDGCNERLILGSDLSVTIENAVFINGLNSHAAELDDGSRFGMIHSGSPLFSVLLPVAKNQKVDYSSFATGIIAGYECALRLATTIAPSHYELGYHPTATCGTIGAAVAIAKMLNYSKTELKDTLSAACLAASGSLKVIEDQSQMKPYNVAKAALNALYASRIGKAGFKGPIDILSGSTGFLEMMSTKRDIKLLFREIDDHFLIHQIYFKPYAACRHAHAPIEASIRIKEENKFSLDDIIAVKVFAYRSLLGKHDSKNINGFSSAKMSIPYSVAIALATGDVGLDKFEDKWINDEKIKKLIKKVEILADENYTLLVPKKRCARVEIELKNNQVFSNFIEYPKGEPENPMTDDELKQKFLKLTSYAGLDLEYSNQIVNDSWLLENRFRQFIDNHYN